MKNSKSIICVLLVYVCCLLPAILVTALKPNVLQIVILYAGTIFGIIYAVVELKDKEYQKKIFPVVSLILILLYLLPTPIINLIRILKRMNHLKLYLYSLPGIFALASALPKKKNIRVILIIIASMIYWFILTEYVQWSYTHPFNPDDGAPLVFSRLFGWLTGLLTLILPLHLFVLFCKWGMKKLKL